MIAQDFDIEVQKAFNKRFFNLPSTNWKKWLDIQSIEDYEELTLKNSGLDSIDDIFERISKEKTNSRAFAINLNHFLKNYNGSDPLLVCHSSGTTNHEISALKWFHMSDWIVKRYWAPGMQAIFESSGLNAQSAAVIFVPSRLRVDGLNHIEDKKYISLYSSEFSQRLTLSIIKPINYTFFEYKNSKNLDIIAKILSLDNISVVSAPALTILGWADREKLQQGILNSLKTVNDKENPILEKLLLKIEKEGIRKATKEIQGLLSKKISPATIVFSISSLSEKDWELIRSFMGWNIGEERFTNLYVASEAGPLAASITKNGYDFSRTGKLFVFPLTIPVIENKGKFQLISRTESKIGNLLISRLDNSQVLINIDIGDVIKIANQKALPQIEGKILRSNFQLKYPIHISQDIPIPSNYQIYVGDFFNFNSFDFYDPRSIINCLNAKSSFKIDSMVLVREKNTMGDKLKLFIPSNTEIECLDPKENEDLLFNCIEDETFKTAIKENNIEIQPICKNPIDFLATREEVLMQVRNGKITKGILKKWPLYVIEI